MELSNNCEAQKESCSVPAPCGNGPDISRGLPTVVKGAGGAETSGQSDSCSNTAATDEFSRSSHTISSRTTSSSSDEFISVASPMRPVRTVSSASPRTIPASASDEDSCLSSTIGEDSITAGSTTSSSRSSNCADASSKLDSKRLGLKDFVVKNSGAAGKPQSTRSLMEYFDTTGGRTRDCGSSMSSLPTSPLRPKGMDERMRKRLSALSSPKQAKGKERDLDKNVSPGGSTRSDRRSSATAEVQDFHRSKGNLDLNLEGATTGQCGGSSRSLRGKRSSFSSQRRQGSDSATRTSRRQRRQTNERSRGANRGSQRRPVSEKVDDDVEASCTTSEKQLYNEALAENQMLHVQAEDQAQELLDRERQIQKLLLSQPELGVDKIEEEEEDDGKAGLDKETMRVELEQMKSTMSRLLKDHEEAETKWKRRLEQAQENAYTMSSAMKERISTLEQQVRDYEDRGEKSGGRNEDFGDIRDERDKLQARVHELERERDDAEARWKRELEDARKDAIAKDAALERAELRIKKFENRGKEGKAPLPPKVHESDDGKISNDSMRSHDSTRSLHSVKKDRRARESYLRLAFSPRTSGRDFQDAAGLIQEASLPNLGDETDETPTTEGTHEKCTMRRRGSNRGDDPKSGLEKLERKVKNLQTECNVLRSALQAKQAEGGDLQSALKEKEEEAEALRLSLAQLQETEWAVRQDMVKYKDEFEVVLEESLSNQEKLKPLEEMNQALQSQVDDLEQQLRELEEQRERERRRKEAEWERKVKECEEHQTDKPTIGREEPAEEFRMSELSTASQAAFLEAAMARKRSSTSSVVAGAPQRAWGLKRLFVHPASSDRTHQDVSSEDIVQLAEENSRLRSELVKLKAQYKEESYVNQKKLVELQQHLAQAAAE